MDNWEEFLNSDLTEENIALMNENWYMPGLEIVKGKQNVYIKIDGNIVGVVSGSGKMNDVEVSLERYIAKSTEGYKPDVPPYSYTEAEIDEILVSAKEQFGEDCSVNFHDGYYVIEDGSETGLVIEHTKNNQVGVEKFKSDVRIATSENGEIGELTAASEIDERNAPIVEKYLSKILDGSEVQVVLNKDGVYEIIVDGVNLGKLEDNATIGDAVSFVQKALKDDTGLSTITDNKVNETNYLRDQTGQNYQVHINKELFEEIKEINRVSAIDMEDCKTLYRTDMLTDELAEAYRELVEIEENIDPDKQFDKTTELLQNLTLNIDYSLQAYDNIDQQLGVVFNSVVQDIFNINAYCKNPEINEYGTLTFKEREEKVKKVLEEYEDTLEELKNELNKDYPASGYDRYAQNIPERQYAVMCTVMQCFLPTDPAYPKDGVGSCSITDLNRFIEFSKEHDLFTKMDNYLVKGQSWDESGMSDLNDVLIHKMSSSHAASDEGFTIDGAMYGFKEDVGYTRQLEQLGIEKLTDANGQAVYRLAASELPSSVFNKDNVHYEYHDGFYYFHDDYDFDLYMFDRSAGNVCEKAFLNSFCFYSGQTTSNPNFNYFDSDSSSTRNLLDPKFLYENGISLYNQDDENKKVAIKSVMSEWYQEDISYTKRGYDKAENYSIGDYVERRIDDYNSVVSDISLVNESVYQFKQYQKLLPYEIEAEGIDYFEFLVKDYSHYRGDDVLTSDKIRFLSQEEIALYEYFKAKNPKKAAGYIDALQDTINQRDGYQQAALRINEVNRNGGDVIDLLTMGKYGLSDGIESFGVGLGDFFVGLDSCLGIGLLGDSNFGEVRSSSDYRNMYMVSLLMEDNRYNDQLSGFMRKTLMYDYQANSSIGNQLIPTLVSFLPCGQVLSPMLLGMSAAGNSIKEAKLSGASNLNSLIYGLASGGSEILMERLLGGITGLNGETAALKGWRALMHSMTEEAREEFLQTYLEGGLKSILLGEPFDISELTGEALVAGLMAMYSAGAMNLSTNCAIKIADDIVYWNSKDFNNFGEFRQFCENKIKDRKALVDISPETAQRMGITLKQGESLKYNPNTKTYQKVKNNGLYRMTIPDSMIKSDVEIEAIKAKHSMDANNTTTETITNSDSEFNDLYKNTDNNSNNRLDDLLIKNDLGLEVDEQQALDELHEKLRPVFGINDTNLPILEKIYLQEKQMGIEADMDVLVELMSKRQMNIKITNDLTAYLPNSNYININPKRVNEIATFLHEVVHAKDKLLFNDLVDAITTDGNGNYFFNGRNYNEMAAKVKERLENPNNPVHEIMKENDRVIAAATEKYMPKGTEIYNEMLKKNGIDDKQAREINALNEYAKDLKYNDYTHLSADQKATVLNDFNNLPQDQKAKFIERGNAQTDAFIRTLGKNVVGNLDPANNVGKVTDMMLAILKGDKNNPIFEGINNYSGHDGDYYVIGSKNDIGYGETLGGIRNQIKETRAQIEAIRKTNPNGLQTLYDIFGQDYIDWISADPTSINTNETVDSMATANDGDLAKYAAPSSGKTNDVFNDLKTHLNATYGVSQDGILGLKVYEDENGNMYSFEAATALRKGEMKNGLPLTHFKEHNSDTFNKLCNYFETAYKMPHNEAVVFLSSVDDTGACSYASVANDIFTSYLGHEDSFKENFGFSMYDDTTGRPNYEMLLADMYLNVNSTANAGQLIVSYSNGENYVNISNLYRTKTDPMGRPLLDTEGQKILSGIGGKNVFVINGYLDSRGSHYDSTIVKGFDDSQVNFKSLSNDVTHALNNGDCFSLSIYAGDSAIRMIPTESGLPMKSTSSWSGGHSTSVTGVTDQGFLVSSWGHEYVIPFSDLKSSNSKWILTKNKVNINQGGKRGK